VVCKFPLFPQPIIPDKEIVHWCKIAIREEEKMKELVLSAPQKDFASDSSNDFELGEWEGWKLPGASDRLANLLTEGQEKGHLSTDDILSSFPQIDEVGLTEIYDMCDGLNITYAEESDESEVDETQNDVDSRLASAFDRTDTVGQYLNEISIVPLLTHSEEVSLAKRMEQGKNSSRQIASGNHAQNHFQQLKDVVENARQARGHLISANTRLVVSVAKKYLGRGVPFLDLIQEGNIGLIRAAIKFDYKRGHRFSTYATWWIRQGVTRAIADQGRTVRVPVHMGDQINKMYKLERQMMQELGRDPSDNELAAALQIPTTKVINMKKISHRPLSLEQPVAGLDEESVLGDFIEDEDSLSPPDEASQNELREQLKEVLGTLPPREVRILQLRYGLLDGKSYTLEEVGRKVGVTRERVRQIEAQALSRIRHPANKRKLEDHLRD